MALNNIDTQITANASKARKEVNNMRKDVNNLKNDTNSLGKSIIEAFKSGNIYGALQKSAIFGWIGAIKNATEGMIRATNAESEYAESLNLLNVAYDKNTESATKLISKMETMYGLDPAGLTKQLGIYKQMTNAMGMSADASALLSENLLKMQEDVSSLYNLDIDVVASKFQSALAGQTRAVRSLGVDITQASLQQELYRLGINRSVRDLNRASKTALIYISMQRQLQKANGDAANTVDHLANQVRIFKEQIAIAGRQIGAVFIPILSAVLPYLNGILMAINEIGKALLLLFHVDVNEMAKQTTSAISVAGGSVGGLGDSIDDVGNSLGGASKKAKDLKKELSGLRDFDKLNVITTPKDSSAGGGAGGGGAGGGAGGGGLGGIDPDLMKFLKPYDLKDIAMEAERIKQAFLDWLKVFKPLEEPFKKLAGLTFDGLKYLWEEILKPVGKWANETLLPTVVDAIAKGLEAVYSAAKSVQPIVLAIMENVVKPFGRVLGRTIVTMLKMIGDIFSAIANNPLLAYLAGSAGLIVAFTKLVGVGKQLYSWFGKTKLGGIITANNYALLESIKETKDFSKGLEEYFNIIVNGGEKTAKSIMGLKINTDALQAATAGAIQTALGASMIVASLQDMEENGLNLIAVVTFLAGAFEAVVGGIQLIIGAYGVLKTLVTESNIFALIVTAIVGAGGFIFALAAADEKMDGTINKFAQLSESEQQNIISHQNQMQAVADLSTELEGLMDSTGHVKEQDEKYVSYILNELNNAYGTNYQLTDGQITRNGHLVGSYKDIQKEIGNYMTKLNAQYLLERYADKYNEALDKKYEKQAKVNAINDVYKQKLEGLKQQYGENYEAEEGYHLAVQDLNKAKQLELDNLRDEYRETEEFFENYSALTKAVAKGDAKEINSSYDALMKLTVTNGKNYVDEYSKAIDQKMKAEEQQRAGYAKTAFGTPEQYRKAGADNSTSYIDQMQSKFNNKTFQLKGKMTVKTTVEDATATYRLVQKADGGFLNKGDVFVAREAGPELVGKIGNRTAVANNDQIVNSIAKGLAMSGIGKDTNVTIVAKEKAGLLDYIEFEQQKRNRQYGL